jgi:hypothetical protein
MVLAGFGTPGFPPASVLGTRIGHLIRSYRAVRTICAAV